MKLFYSGMSHVLWREGHILGGGHLALGQGLTDVMQLDVVTAVQFCVPRNLMVSSHTEVEPY